jgi:hypothetical protein
MRIKLVLLRITIQRKMVGPLSVDAIGIKTDSSQRR